MPAWQVPAAGSSISVEAFTAKLPQLLPLDVGSEAPTDAGAAASSSGKGSSKGRRRNSGANGSVASDTNTIASPEPASTSSSTSNSSTSNGTSSSGSSAAWPSLTAATSGNGNGGPAQPGPAPAPSRLLQPPSLTRASSDARRLRPPAFDDAPARHSGPAPTHRTPPGPDGWLTTLDVPPPPSAAVQLRRINAWSTAGYHAQKAHELLALLQAPLQRQCGPGLAQHAYDILRAGPDNVPDGPGTVQRLLLTYIPARATMEQLERLTADFADYFGPRLINCALSAVVRLAPEGVQVCCASHAEMPCRSAAANILCGVASRSCIFWRP